MAVIIAPNPNAKPVAGVTFVDGRATVDSPALVAWFRRKGYTVTDDAPAHADNPVVDIDPAGVVTGLTPLTAKRPAQSEPKAAWVAYAIARGMSPEVAKVTSKADLIGMHS